MLTAISKAGKAENGRKNRKNAEELHHFGRLLAAINETDDRNDQRWASKDYQRDFKVNTRSEGSQKLSKILNKIDNFWYFLNRKTVPDMIFCVFYFRADDIKLLEDPKKRANHRSETEEKCKSI